MRKLLIERFPRLSYACGEAINTLCTNLTFSGENVRKIMITSCHASEGKSFIAMNIVRTLAAIGKKVVYVDADLRRSAIVSKYHVRYENGGEREKVIGLSHMLAGMTSLMDVVYSTNIDGALMVPAGKLLENPLSLFNSPKFPALLDNLADIADYVIVDAAPIGTVIDAAQIAKYCDGILMVVGYNAVHRQELLDVQSQLTKTGCPILGAILNQVEIDSYLNKKYYYKAYSNYYNYSSESDDKPKRKKKYTEKRRKTTA